MLVVLFASSHAQAANIKVFRFGKDLVMDCHEAYQKATESNI